MLEFHIRDAQRSDVPRLENIEKLCFSTPWTAEQIISQLPDQSHVFICAEREGEVLGYVNAMLICDEGYISNVATDPQYRRCGVGDSLLESIAARGVELGLSFLTLEVRSGNTPAIELYKKHGFVPVGERKNYYEKPRENAILMTLFLK